MQYNLKSYQGAPAYILWCQRLSEIGSQLLEWQPCKLFIDVKEPGWELYLSHEWGHCLAAMIFPKHREEVLAFYKVKGPHGPSARTICSRAKSSNPYMKSRFIAWELVAFRLAKSFLRPELWHETFVLKYMNDWLEDLGYKGRLQSIEPYQPQMLKRCELEYGEAPKP